MSDQPTVDAIDAFNDRVVVFSDGEVGRITNWVDRSGENHHEPVVDAIAVVAAYPGPVPFPWYAAALGHDERHPDFPNP